MPYVDSPKNNPYQNGGLLDVTFKNNPGLDWQGFFNWLNESSRKNPVVYDAPNWGWSPSGITPEYQQGFIDSYKKTLNQSGNKGVTGYPDDVNQFPSTTRPNPTTPPVITTPQKPNQTDIWQDTWQPTGNPYSEAWKNISPNIGTKESTPSNTTVNTTNPASGQGNFPKLPNITQDVMQELDSLNGVNTWGNFKTTGMGNQTNPNYTESKGYYVNPYTGEYSF